MRRSCGEPATIYDFPISYSVYCTSTSLISGLQYGRHTDMILSSPQNDPFVPDEHACGDMDTVSTNHGDLNSRNSRSSTTSKTSTPGDPAIVDRANDSPDSDHTLVGGVEKDMVGLGIGS